jgi:hypothetical protein
MFCVLNRKVVEVVRGGVDLVFSSLPKCAPYFAYIRTRPLAIETYVGLKKTGFIKYVIGDDESDMASEGSYMWLMR